MGGKSRKSGGVSKRLIDRIKSGAYETTNNETPQNSKSNQGKKKNDNKGGFGLLSDKDE